jgi:hypothetical protein
MKIKNKIFLVLFALFLLGAIDYRPSIASAAVPRLINYQGKLTDTSGAPLEGSYTLTFRIYDAATAGNLLWEETQPGVVVDNGLFSILLGSATALNIPFDRPYYLEIKVGNEVMTPRQQITSAGYAIRAEKADSVDGIDPGMVGTKTVNETGLADGMVPYYDGASGAIKYKSDKRQLFTSSGVFIAPPGVTMVYLSGCAGGGGGGGSVRMSQIHGGGGGAGANIMKLPYAVTPGNNYTVTIGVGGAGGVAGANSGLTGGSTVFGGITLLGGGGGGSYVAGSQGGASGGKAYLGAGVGLGHTDSSGAAGAANGGAGGGGLFGNGGAGRVGSNGAGFVPTLGYGGGGGGARGTYAGGAGAQGMMLVEW